MELGVTGRRGLSSRGLSGNPGERGDSPDGEGELPSGSIRGGSQSGQRNGAGGSCRGRARALESLQGTYPGVAVETTGDELHITIPDRYRVGHEAHFAQVVEEFLKYLKSPNQFPPGNGPICWRSTL